MSLPWGKCPCTEPLFWAPPAGCPRCGEPTTGTMIVDNTPEPEAVEQPRPHEPSRAFIDGKREKP